ncbi:MAG: HAD hydrolase family protein, partial [Holdemanella sp.]|nr:HAD hydrolase family protein [Holdemanella sp.]
LNYEEKDIVEYLKSVSVTLEVADNFDEIAQHDLIEITIALPEALEPELLKGTTTIKASRWCPLACDLISNTGGKDVGIQKILDYYGFTKNDAMAFGDGGNDKTMLEYVGLGIAMGNAVEDVKEIADYITDSVSEDGIYTALVHYGFIKEM